MTVLVTTVETITRQYEVEVPDGTTADKICSKVDEAEEVRNSWNECDFTAIEYTTEIATTKGKVLWMQRK